MLKSTFSGYTAVADDTGLSSFVVACEICEIPPNSLKIQTYTVQSHPFQSHRCWCQSKVHMQLPIRH